MIAHATSARRAWVETVQGHRDRIAAAWDTLQGQLALAEQFRARAERGQHRYTAATLRLYRSRVRGYQQAYADTLAYLRWLVLDAPAPTYRAWRDPVAAAERVEYEHDFGPRTQGLDAWLRGQLEGLSGRTA